MYFIVQTFMLSILWKSRNKILLNVVKNFATASQLRSLLIRKGTFDFIQYIV